MRFRGKALSPLGVFVPYALYPSHMCSPLGLFFFFFCTPTVSTYMSISANRLQKVEPIHLESGHCWINRRDAQCDWLRGYDVTLWFFKLRWLGPAWSGAHPESAGQRSKEGIRLEILEITIGAQGDGCYDAFVKEKRKKKGEMKQWYSCGRIICVHSDPLKAIMKQDTNLISHLGSNKPNVTGSFS